MYVRTVTVAGDCPTASDAVFEQTKVLENRKVGPKREKKQQLLEVRYAQHDRSFSGL